MINDEYTADQPQTNEMAVNAAELEFARRFPAFDELRPGPNTTKTFMTRGGEIDMREASSERHEDGVAYNAQTQTAVVCDGMGGVGVAGDFRSDFAYALAHAVAELEDIGMLNLEEGVTYVTERSKQILADQLGTLPQAQESRIRGAMADIEVGSTIAAVQRVGATRDWHVVTFGDSSVLHIGADGNLRQGFGEASQAFYNGQINTFGMAVETPLKSKIGLAKNTLAPVVDYGPDRQAAQFATIRLEYGETIIVVSDAYLQKSTLQQCLADAAMSPQEWGQKDPAKTYGDDATMVIIRG